MDKTDKTCPSYVSNRLVSQDEIPYSPQNNAALYEIYSNENPRYTRVSYDIYVAITRIL